MTHDDGTTAPVEPSSRWVGHRQILANTGWLFVDKAVVAVVGVLVGAWVARYLRPASFGLLSYAVAFVQFLVPVAGLGLQTIVIRDLVRDPDSKNDILGTALALRLGVSTLLVAALCVGFGIGLGPHDTVLRWLIVVVSTQIIFNAHSDTISDWFESQTELKFVVWARNAAMILVAALKVGLILLSAPLLAFGAATSAQALAFAIGMSVLYLVTGNRISALRASLARAKSLLSDSWPLIFAGIAVVTYMRIDQIMLGHLADSQTLGRYSAAVYLSELWYFIPVAVARSVFPTIVQFRQNQPFAIFQRHMQTFFDAMVAVAYAIAIPLTILAPPLVILTFGPEYAEAVPVLRVHIWAFVFVALGEARYRWLMVDNFVRFAMTATLLGAALNIGLNLVLIPRFGGVGAAWATLVSQLLSAYLSSVLHPRLRVVFKQATLALAVPVRLPSLVTSIRRMLR